MSPIINSKIDIEVNKEHPFLEILKKILYPVSLELRKFSSKNLRIREKNFGNSGSRTPSISPFEAKNFIFHFTREAINKKWPWCWWNSLFQKTGRVKPVLWGWGWTCIESRRKVEQGRSSKSQWHGVVDIV